MADTSPVEMYAVPRALLRAIRCDLLLAASELRNPSPSNQDVIDLLRKDYDELLAIASYRYRV